MSYNGYKNWETWNAFNWISSDYNLIKYFESEKINLKDFKQIVIEFIINIPDNITISKIDFKDLYNSVYCE